ncbi:MAG: sulfotransferase, partial [Pirellulales bacterium]|nr:sulfotransferase [Pirellulales bacterium]
NRWILSQNRTTERNLERWRFRAMKVLKRARWALRRPGSSKVLWIFGCQRSGTTLLGRVLERDHRALVMQEDSILTGTSHGRLRLKALDEVETLIGQVRHPLIVVKPLVESQRAGEILDRFPDSRAIWMHRDVQDVVNSHVKRFKGQRTFLDALLGGGEDDWRAQNTSAETREVIAKYHHAEISREDAAALIWIARNRLLFEQDLIDHPRLFVLDYRDLVLHSNDKLQAIYESLDLDFPRSPLAQVIDDKSLNQGSRITLNEEIAQLCDQLADRLHSCTPSVARST